MYLIIQTKNKHLANIAKEYTLNISCTKSVHEYQEYSPIMKHFCNEEILREEFAKPRQPIEVVEFHFFDNIRHASKTVDTHTVQSQIISGYTGTKIDLKTDREMHSSW